MYPAVYEVVITFNSACVVCRHNRIEESATTGPRLDTRTVTVNNPSGAQPPACIGCTAIA